MKKRKVTMMGNIKPIGYIQRDCPSCGVTFEEMGWVKVADPTEEILSTEMGCPSCGDVFKWPDMEEIDLSINE